VSVEADDSGEGSVRESRAMSQDIEMAYEKMSEDHDREREALTWSEGVLADLE
jgi:hypothetical protein